MSEVMITVRGEHEVRVAPERAVVSLNVSLEGPDRADVVARTTALADPIRAGISAGETAGAVTSWTSRRLAVRSERPWSNDGTRLALVHHATVDFTATFADFGALSLWVAEVSSIDGVTILGTDWILTPDTRARVEQEVSTEAVRTAVTRAGAYAAALGLSTVTPIEIADAGLIADGPGPAPMLRAGAMLALAAPPDSSGVELQGDDITVSATVEARFVAA
ncbi:MAG: SIMPL domain-containing protein [Actinobacteria bacterium]|nr:SIMPL domain-containing protein [Actinomycetota bacterium]